MIGNTQIVSLNSAGHFSYIVVGIIGTQICLIGHPFGISILAGSHHGAGNMTGMIDHIFR